ncbi:unnamed protein product [Rotaria magnacalcarata]|uniref:VCBS repeat-containing protein n=1 Tax=Rotaria magnacalcarata TaxID=392030 RepID=A0A8S2KLU5_9BILA|nr:unnamed protein product [Rotaria magnacalcarata]
MLDIAVTNHGNNSVGVFLGYDNGTFSNQITYSVGTASPYATERKRTFPSQDNDCARNAHFMARIFYEPYIWEEFQVESTSFTRRKCFSILGFSKFQTSVFPPDNHLDIIVINNGTASIGIPLGFDEVTFESSMIYHTDFGPYSAAVGDFNNDHILDIVITESQDNIVSVLVGYGNGYLGKQSAYSTGSHPYFLALSDFNKDTRLDIVAGNYNDKTISILLGFGNFNNERLMDIGVANSGANNVGIFLGYGNSLFTSQMVFSGDSTPYSIAVGDFNRDDILDLVVASYASNNIGVFLGYGKGSLLRQKTFVTGGSNSQSISIAVADFSNDNFLDIVMTNYGENTVGV